MNEATKENALYDSREADEFIEVLLSFRSEEDLEALEENFLAE